VLLRLLPNPDCQLHRFHHPEQQQKPCVMDLICCNTFIAAVLSSSPTGAKFSNTSNTPPPLRSFSSISRILYFIDDLEFLVVVCNLNMTALLFCYNFTGRAHLIHFNSIQFLQVRLVGKKRGMSKEKASQLFP
jgi:hypothetical protein